MPQPTPWDPELSKAMVATGCVLLEESVANDLIRDLSKQGRPEQVMVEPRSRPAELPAPPRSGG